MRVKELGCEVGDIGIEQFMHRIVNQGNKYNGKLLEYIKQECDFLICFHFCNGFYCCVIVAKTATKHKFRGYCNSPREK